MCHSEKAHLAVKMDRKVADGRRCARFRNRGSAVVDREVKSGAEDNIRGLSSQGAMVGGVRGVHLAPLVTTRHLKLDATKLNVCG